jgi:tetratricopeptide (TPR) repeat protein
LCPRNNGFFYFKADALKTLEKYDEALNYYNFALENVPLEKYKQLRNQMAICYKVTGMKQKKEKKYQSALAMFDLAINKCTEDYEDKYSLFWW